MPEPADRVPEPEHGRARSGDAAARTTGAAPRAEIAAPPAARPAKSALTPAAVVAMQRQVGNRAVRSMLGPPRQGSAPPEATVQRAPDGGQQAAIDSRANAVAEQARDSAAEHEGEQPPPVDPAEKAAARARQQGDFAQPDKVSGPAAEVRSTATQTGSEVAAPAEPVVPEKSAEPPAGADHGPASAAAAALATGQAQASAAQAQAAALPVPEAPPELVAPAVVEPVDSTGAPLPVSPAGDIAAGLVATRLAHLRHGAQTLAIDATTHRARALGLRAALAEARGKVDEAAGSISTVKGQVTHRRTVAEQAAAALDTSKQKADTVASQAPGIAAQAESGRGQTGPMAQESATLAGNAAGAAPDDAEAAAKTRQQSGQITEVSGNLTSIDSAVGQTGARAQQLQADAEQAKSQNATSETTISGARERLDATDGKLAELSTMNDAARGRVEGLAGGPDEIEAGAAAQRERADAVVANSVQLEGRLHAVQEGYRSELAGLPGPPPRRDARVPAAYAAGPDGVPGQSAGGLVAQRQAAPEAGEPEKFPSFNEAAETISGDHQSAQERAAAAVAAQRRQQQELAEINAAAGGDFSTLGAGDKASLALRLTFSRTFGSLGETNWPKFGLGILRGFVDPRVSLAGVVQGFGMILSGGANLLSLAQWRRDPLGNLLKSAADIATGVTVVLGSIAGLAVAVIAISAALILVSWGFLAPALLPVISIASTVAATVGPWAITAAEVALVLNGLVFIKNLIDAATASTAAELQGKSMAMGEDVNAMGMMAMQIAGDKLGKAVGPRIGGALEGVQGNLANSGNAAGVMLAKNMTKIGGAMTAGQARADAWAGRDVPTVGGAPPSDASAGGGAGAGGPEVAAPGAEVAAPAGGGGVDTAPPSAGGSGPAPAVDTVPAPAGGGGAAVDTAAGPAAGPAPVVDAVPGPVAAVDAVPPSAVDGTPGPAPVVDTAPGPAAGLVPAVDAVPPSPVDSAPGPAVDTTPGPAGEAGPAPAVDAVPPSAVDSPPAPTVDSAPAAPSASPAPDTAPAPAQPAQPAPAGPAPVTAGDLPSGAAANDNAVPPSGPGAGELAELPPELRGGQPANDNAVIGPEANEQVLAATGTDDAVAVVGKPKLTVIEGGAGNPDAPRAMAGNNDLPGGSGPDVPAGTTGPQTGPSGPGPGPGGAGTESGGPHEPVPAREPAPAGTEGLAPASEAGPTPAEQPATVADEAAPPETEGAAPVEAPPERPAVDLKRRAFKVLERAERMPANDPLRRELIQRAQQLRETFAELDGMGPLDRAQVEHLAGEDIAALGELENALPPPPPPAPAFSEGDHTPLSQDGGLAATEGHEVIGPDGSAGEKTHPLTKHGPGADDNYLIKQARKAVNKMAARFTDRAAMETAIGSAIDANQAAIDTWLAGNPPAGENLRLPRHDPGMGNLGEGVQVNPVTGDIEPIPTATTPLTEVQVIVKATGQTGPGTRPYVIQTAYPVVPGR